MKFLSSVAAIVLASSTQVDALFIQRLHSAKGCQLHSTEPPPRVVCYYASDDYSNNGLQGAIKRRRPRRSMPHIKTTSRAEEASRAGYIIRQNLADVAVKAGTGDSSRNRTVRPLRVIRRIVRRRDVHRSESLKETPLDHDFDCDELTEEVMVELRYRSKSRPHAMSRNPKILNAPNRVTFKSTRQASHFIQGLCTSISASLTEYMTQPVEQYSLLSFHDEEPAEKTSSAKTRRWLVRRLTAAEAHRYIDNSNQEVSSTNFDNLFRLAVPLQPLIGWDLTPVIDLEVIPPDSKMILNRNLESDAAMNDASNNMSKWTPLKGIRERVGVGGHNESFNKGQLPVVKIRSLSVSLLSTQEEVNAYMQEKELKSNKSHRHHSSKMQEEAIGMVGKVEEWLKPHITFEAELSWNNEKGDIFANDHDVYSTVTAKATAITSLTIPKIPSGILRAAVPSAFLVKRLGATLTSKALEICLPRFLRQLERDYKRWSGVEKKS